MRRLDSEIESFNRREEAAAQARVESFVWPKTGVQVWRLTLPVCLVMADRLTKLLMNGSSN